ncbi:MAG: hypothetical protein K2X03_15685 [Bryobacteraceae bacterium]|nr:hypothetical protein [Bryobacteraceae bacterium]
MISRNVRLSWLALCVATAWSGTPGYGRDGSEAVVICGTLAGLEGMEAVKSRGVATQILREAGVKLEWQNGTKACTAPGSGLILSGSLATPEGRKPGVLATSKVYEGKHIVVFVDRVKKTFSPEQVAPVLGHVLAHEIVHMLQGIDRHSETGLMKAVWKTEDYDQMSRAPMTLSERDLRLIQDGLATRRSRQNPVAEVN